MKDLSERDKLIQSLKNISDKGGVDALNYILKQPDFISDNRRNYCFQFFVQEKITSVTIVDKTKLEKIERSLINRNIEQASIPHAPNHWDFLNQIIQTKKNSKQDNFFAYEKKQLIVVAEGKCRKPMEKILRGMGLKIIYLSF